MSDNARFHNKLHRKNHHSVCTSGYPDSATDPIASIAEPFQGDFYLNGNLNVAGAINTTFSSLSNINIPTPVLSATIGFNPTSSLIVILSGTQYAIPVTPVGILGTPPPSTIKNTISGTTTFYNNVSVGGTLFGMDSTNWNDTRTLVSNNSANWNVGYNAYTVVNSSSGNWNSTYSIVQSNSAAWTNYQAYYLNSNIFAIQPNYNGVNASGRYSVIGGGNNNTASGCYSVIDGGNNNTASGCYSVIGGGNYNQALSGYSTVAGGCNNFASSKWSTVGGGYNNTASGLYSSVGGGSTNTTASDYTVIGGGISNCTGNLYAVVAGGIYNTTCGKYSAILGGQYNTVSGDNSFALGSYICTNVPNYTFVNNLSSQGFVQSASANLGFLSVGTLSASVLPNTIAQFVVANNSYSQINVQNTNSGAYASTDVVMTADNGTDSQNYIDVGINSSTYAASAFSINGPNDAYVYTQGNNLTIGTATSANILFHTGGTLTNNERVRITSLGYMGIGTSTPNTNLTVVGNISATGNAYFNNAIYCVGSNSGSIQPVKGSNTTSSVYAYVGSGNFNQATGNGSVTVGGCLNASNGNQSSVGGGCANNANGIGSVIAGGYSNNTNSNYGSILGGRDNIVSCYGAVGGGWTNTATGCFAVVGGGRGNTNSGFYSVIAGGYNNTNSGCCNFIAGGYNNNISSGICNAFVLGSGINATNSGYTYVNGIIVNNGICATSLSATNINTTTINSANLSSTNIVWSYNSIACDSYVNRNSIINGNLTVGGSINMSSFLCLPNNKYTSVFGTSALSSYSFNHNLNTTDLAMTVIDITTRQVVYPTLTIVDSNQVQANFSFLPQTSAYKISILGF
jgi:hypothetical protein